MNLYSVIMFFTAFFAPLPSTFFFQTAPPAIFPPHTSTNEKVFSRTRNPPAFQLTRTTLFQQVPAITIRNLRAAIQRTQGSAVEAVQIHSLFVESWENSLLRVNQEKSARALRVSATELSLPPDRCRSL